MTLDLGTVGRETTLREQRYDWRDAALYAISLGCGQGDYAFVRNDPPPRVLPTFAVVPAFQPIFEALGFTGGNLVTLLHSGQRVELLAPFPAAGVMTTRARVAGIWDMKIGAFVVIDSETEVEGAAVARTSWQLLLRGEGGFGGERPPAILRTKPPEAAPPDLRVEVPTHANQALLYRLNGDINPIHADPAVARAAGFDRPILHGLCSYGIAARHALRTLAGDDPRRFVSFEARFSKVVMPGDTLIVEAWQLGEPGQAAVTVTVGETGEKAIANALFTYRP